MTDQNQKPDTGMAKLFLSIARTMPEGMLFDELKSAIAKYESDKSEHNKKHLYFYLQMTTMRFMHQEETIEESLKTIDDIADMVGRDKIINT